MDGLRVNRGEKRIEVNDEGEYITLNLADQSFVSRLGGIVEMFNGRLPEFEARAAELDALPADTPDALFQKQKAAADYNLEIHQSLKDEIDGLFHDEACRKVFGNIVPSTDMYVDFFQQLTPFLEKYAKERNTKINKYNAQRTGNV